MIAIYQQYMYKLHKSKSNPSKINLVTPSYNGSKLAPQSSRQFLNRSASGSKKFGVRQLSPSCRLKESKEKQKIQTKIQINNLNFNLLICNNKQSGLTSPFSARSHNNNKYNLNLSQRTKFFKANQGIKMMSKMSEATEHKKKSQPSNRFDFNPIKVLAKGQYGNLYLAYSKQTNFVVVLKSFHKQKVTLDFMIDEFKIQIYCRHPNILPAYGFFFGKTEVYLIMEAGSHNLYRQVKQAGYLSERKTATYIHQVLKGLAYLHLNGIIHRDIKPENIIICGNVAKISDFGWSIITQSERKTFCGTIDYVSPQVCSGKSYDNKIDCWSIGVLAYQLLTGFPPFQEIKAKKQRPTLNFKQAVRFPNTISALAKQFIKKMLNFSPEQRPSAVEALRDIWIQNYSDQFQKKSGFSDQSTY